jgi:hypothetical protein
LDHAGAEPGVANTHPDVFGRGITRVKYYNDFDPYAARRVGKPLENV